jgi:hypothetical protein
MRFQLVAVLAAGLALAACQPAAKKEDSAPEAAPTTEAAGPPSVTLEPIEGTSGSTLVFGPEQSVVVHALLMPDNAKVAAEKGAEPKPIADILGGPQDTLASFSVEEERWRGGEPLCGLRPATAVVLKVDVNGPDKLAAITGALPGEKGAELCNVREVEYHPK